LIHAICHRKNGSSGRENKEENHNIDLEGKVTVGRLLCLGLNLL
jgi:hypothetical protein